MAAFDDLIQEVRLLAMNSIVHPNVESIIRKMCRWYSTTFCTPLHIVEQEIPIETVFQQYFESRYEKMEDEERDMELEDVLLSHDERIAKDKKAKQQAVKEQQSDDEFLEKIKKAAEKNPEYNKELAKGDDIGSLAGIKGIGGTPLTAIKDSISLKDLPPDINISFVDDLDGSVDDWDMMGVGEKKQS